MLTQLEKLFNSNTNRLNMTIAFVFLTSALAMAEFRIGPVTVGFSSLLTCMMLGTLFCNLCPLSGEIMEKADRWTSPLFAAFFVIIFGIIFFRIAPALTRQSRKVADNIGNDLQGISPNELIGGTLGLVIGLVIAFLLTRIYQDVVNQKTLYLTITICMYLTLGFLGVVVGNKKISELLAMTGGRKAATQVKTQVEENSYGYNAKDKKSARIPKILDTSVIIDGRILSVEFME